MLRARAQLEAPLQALGEGAATALGQEGVFRVHLDSRGEGVLLLAVAADSHIAGSHALDPAVPVVEHLGGGEARVDLHPHRFRLLGEPAAEVA